MSQITTRPPNAEEQSILDGATAWVNELLEKEFKTKIRLTGTREDIPNLHTMLSEGPYTADPNAELTTFGIVFGHVLAREIPMRWVFYRDEQGSDLALQYQDLELFSFPCDMIFKRVEEGEDINEINLDLMLENLREALAEEAEKMRRSR
ncbi:DUF3806 domain-containing protein [Luteolibacter luteus]|uniref:DUF3806 domain-containing protein n=1 Tax=Luteolibacter luteus TaxID=2728835 RepID=A0A858RM75_9BACT|nr:DUF3806 domain-containing protein [Luteolibacter luteus]QJE98077.1 DUF3806 domain-containing protein [Luteolibacter luteus]